MVSSTEIPVVVDMFKMTWAGVCMLQEISKSDQDNSFNQGTGSIKISSYYLLDTSYYICNSFRAW